MKGNTMSHVAVSIRGWFVLSVVLYFLMGCGESEQAPSLAIKPIRIVTVGQSVIPVGRQFVGRAEPSQSAALSFRISGRLVELPVKAGDILMENQVVAQLDRRDYETRMQDIQSQLDQARAVLSQMRAGARPEELERMQAALTARESELNETEAEFKRYEELLRKSIVSRQEFERVASRRDTARASYEIARQELAIGVKGARDEEVAAQNAVIRGLEARLQEVRNTLSDTELRAPFGGVLARVEARNYEDIQANQPIAVLQNIDQMDVVINISEQDMSGRRGQARDSDPDRIVGFVTFPVFGEDRFPVRLKEFQTEADPQSQTYQVVLQMTQPEGRPVRPGMSAVVHGEAGTAAEDGVYFVPLHAVFAGSDGTPTVWVIDPETMQARPRSVKTGSIMQDQIAVEQGLQAGEQIAASAVNLLREGMQVEAMSDLGEL